MSRFLNNSVKYYLLFVSHLSIDLDLFLYSIVLLFLEVDVFYQNIQNVLKNTSKSMISILYLNAKVSKIHVKEITGNYRLESRNKKGDWLIQFCSKGEYSIMNTYFK